MDDLTFNEADCLAQVREGDEMAARRLVEHLYPFVIRIVRRHLPRRGSEEELMQDIFIKMFAKLDRFRGEVALEHWVSRIAVNHCLNAIRAQKNRPEWRMGDLSLEQAQAIETLTASPTGDHHPTQAMAAREIVELLLEGLSPEDRIVIRMLEMEDRSTEEIARATGWSLTKVRIRAFRARKKLNQRFHRLKKARQL